MGKSIKSTQRCCDGNIWTYLPKDEVIHFIKDHDFAGVFDKRHIDRQKINNSSTWGFFHKHWPKGVVLLEPRTKDKPPIVHIAFDKSIRGKLALKACEDWFADYLPLYGKIVGFTPLKWRHACLFARMLKPTRFFKTPNYLVTEFEK